MAKEMPVVDIDVRDMSAIAMFLLKAWPHMYLQHHKCGYKSFLKGSTQVKTVAN